jgi:DNA-binding NarL/FixJ family response regulator
VYSDYISYTHISAAVAAGANGFIGKDENEEMLRYALGEIAKGNTYFSQTAMRKMSTHNEFLNQLSAREKEVFILVQQGHTNYAIADALQLSAHTIENYISSLYAKTKTETREELQLL